MKRPLPSQSYPVGLVECRECGKQFRSLYRHLASHGITAAQYRLKHPGAPTACEEVHRKQRQGGAEGNEILRRMPPGTTRRQVRFGGAPDTTNPSPGQGAQNGTQGGPAD